MFDRAGTLRLVFIAALSFLIRLPAAAQTPSGSDIPYSRSDKQEIVIGRDGLITATISNRVKILTAAAVQSAGTSRDTINAHFFDYEILSAATIKPDGRRVPVDPAKIIVEKAPSAMSLRPRCG